MDWKADEAFIVGVSNDTSVLIYRLSNYTLVDEVKLNSMDKRLIRLPHGGVYKILSDNPVHVVLFSAEKMLSVEENAGPILIGFRSSVNGTYVGSFSFSLHLRAFLASHIGYLPLRGLRLLYEMRMVRST